MLPFLLTGGSGRLGSALRASGKLPFISPTHKELDITSRDSIERYFSLHSFQGIIHCAAIARMAICEQNPALAVATNVGGTSHLVQSALSRQIRFLYISTDGVYAGTKGNYAEEDPTIPYNTYGWTKLAAECTVRAVPNHCIIRTSFFDPENIRFDTAATDAYSSRIPLNDVVNAIVRLATHTFRGTINVGGERQAEYERYKKYKPSIQPCTLADIQKQAGSPLAKDASMNCQRWKNLR